MSEVAENSVHAAAYMRPIANISALPHANAKQPSKHFSTQIESVSQLHTDHIEFLFTGSILYSELRSEVAENSVHADFKMSTNLVLALSRRLQ
jgi:hypothetical protein